MTIKHNRNLDILRGIAALTVVLYHIISNYATTFDKNYNVSAFLNYNFPGHMAVLIFFILSGYVIGINTERLTDKKTIISYIRKRLVRIVPIYFVAILFTVLITLGAYNWQTILSNLFFVSVPLNNVMIEDGPLWSLNYELIYYFIFIIFSYYNINLVKTVKALLIIIMTLFVFFHNVAIYPLMLSYLIGFLFWITGAMIAKNTSFSTWKISGSRMISIFLLIFCLQPLNPYGPLLKVLKINVADYSKYSWFQTSISYRDLYYYPLTIILILSLTHLYSKKSIFLLYFIFISAVARLLMIYKVYGIDFIVKEHYVTPAIIIITSIALWMLNFQLKDKIKARIYLLASSGNISYGLYVIHMPIIYLFGHIIAASPFYFAIKLTGYFVVLFLFSYLLEMKYQPFIKKILRKKSPSITKTGSGIKKE